MKPRIKTMDCLPANPRPSNLTSSTCSGTNGAQHAQPPATRHWEMKKRQMKVHLFQKEQRRRDHSQSGNPGRQCRGDIRK